MRELSLSDGDVSFVTYPANPSATAKIRAMRDTVAAAPVLAQMIKQLQEGRSISDEDMAVLAKILDSIAAADVEIDKAQADLAEVLGVENPDDDETPAEDEMEIAEEPVRSLSPAARLLAAQAAQSAFAISRKFGSAETKKG